MANFTVEDALRSRWSASAKPRAVRTFAVLGIVLAVAALGLGYLASSAPGAGYWLAVLGTALAGVAAMTCLGAAFVIQFSRLVGTWLFRLAFLIFVGGLVGIALLAWVPALLYEQVDAAVADHYGAGATGVLTVADLEAVGWALPTDSIEVRRQGAVGWAPPTDSIDGRGKAVVGSAHPTASFLAYALWPLQFRLTRDILALVGVVGFVSLLAMFTIWWERKVAGRMQSRLGPMRVGGWHGWAQSMADGIKLLQKEDIYLEGADRPLFKLAPYIAFMPALALFLALPFSAAWICRDLDIGLLFILALAGIGVLGVIVAGWASNNKWSLLGAMREACQMISYEIPLGFALLVPVMTTGTLRLTAIGELQAGGFHTWLAFQSPFTLAAAVLFFTATLAACKRAPFDLPEAESELVAGVYTEYSGFRWSLFFFAEYAEMFAVGALAAILFFGAWYSPLPANWGAAWLHGPLWQRALYGILFNGPLWLIFKGFFFLFVQIWLRWTLPRIRLDQVMYACVQVMLPLSMLVLLGATFWALLVPHGSMLAVVANLACTALGVGAVLAIIGIVFYGYSNRRQLVGTLAIEHWPGS
jgi:NADH-quinone oxidoreductase subunit H